MYITYSILSVSFFVLSYRHVDFMILPADKTAKKVETLTVKAPHLAQLYFRTSQNVLAEVARFYRSTSRSDQGHISTEISIIV